MTTEQIDLSVIDEELQNVDVEFDNFYMMFNDFVDVMDQLPTPTKMFICPVNSISVAIH